MRFIRQDVVSEAEARALGGFDIAFHGQGHSGPGGTKDLGSVACLPVDTGSLDHPYGEGREDRVREPRPNTVNGSSAVGGDPVAPFDPLHRRCRVRFIQQRQEFHSCLPDRVVQI